MYFCSFVWILNVGKGRPRIFKYCSRWRIERDYMRIAHITTAKSHTGYILKQNFYVDYCVNFILLNVEICIFILKQGSLEEQDHWS